MIRRIIFGVGLVLLATALAAQNPEKIWNFDADRTGSIPEGLTANVGEWKVVGDPTAPSKPNVLAQMGKNSKSTFNICLVNGTNYKDLDVSVKMKAIAGNGAWPSWQRMFVRGRS